MSQPARTETLGKFKSGEISLLVCSDVAARGLDIPDMSHVFNFDVPIHAEDYVHRIGRTGRAGRQGRALTIATPEDGKYLAAIEKITNLKIPVIELKGIDADDLKPAEDEPSRSPRGGRDGKGRRGRGRGGRNQLKKSVTAAGEPARTPADKTKGPGQGSGKDSGEKPKKAEKRDAPPAQAKPDHSPSTQAKGPDKGPVKGLGDHMPAFLMTAPPKSNSK